MDMKPINACTRRCFLRGATVLGLLAGTGRLVPAFAQQSAGSGMSGSADIGSGVFALSIRKHTMKIAGRDATATTINGTVPGPLLRFREGETVTIRVTNEMEETTSIHWHGLILPASMDGVPGVSFPGIKPSETFTYRYPVTQYGTYWYHSHSGPQEQTGIYGPLIIDPAEPDPYAYDREYVVMFSDWTFENPHRLLQNVKSRPSYYNFQRRTLFDFARDVQKEGWGATLTDRLEWGRMRMDPTDIADITGATYTYLINGLPPEANWTARFRPGERVRLRFINGAAMTYFDVRIPGLPMTVVQAHGQNIQPVTVDEFRMAVAETYDVIVEPKEDRAYTIFAETMDRSGYARGTLATRDGMAAPLPERRPRALRTMVDMGMEMEMADMPGMEMGTGSMSSSEQEGHGSGAEPGSSSLPSGGHAGHGQRADMGAQNLSAREQQGQMSSQMEKAGPVVARHGPEGHGPGNTTVAMVQRNRLGEPGIGLEDAGHRVLVYNDLRNVKPGYDRRKPGREIELHITGNMERYMWSLDGKTFWEVTGPIPFSYGERLRMTLVNDTMMDHPFHLHGMWMELDNGAGVYKPRLHTLNVKAAERLSFEVTADALGQWAFHCHLLYHMDMGMLRVISVS